ncbi:MAG: MmgE/PrpD family protein [Haloferacaceae archaeon]
MSPTPTETVVDHALSVEYDAIEEEVRDRLRRHVLDLVGVSVGARSVAASTPPVERAVDRIAGAGEEATAFSGERMAAADAALLNGTLAHSLDYDDTHRESSLHPGAPVVPAALAVAEREGADAATFLAAVKVGYDVTCTLGRAVDPDSHYARGFHPTATCGTFGAAVAAGVVAGLDREGLRAAMGVAGSQAAGSLQYLKNGAWNKRLHGGLAARRGVEAATLADVGFHAAAEPLAGDKGFFQGYSDDADPSIVADVRERESVMETALKPYPCCRYMHAALDALLDLAPEVDASAVESVTVDIPGPGVRLTGDPIERKRRPENFVDCQFSMPFGAALALERGDAGLAAFRDAQDGLDDPDLRRLMDLTDVVTTDAVAELFPEQWAARVVVETGDERLERFVEVASGEPEKPLDWGDIGEKFDELATAAGVPDAAAEAVKTTARGLGETTDLDDLLAALRDATAADPARAD